MKYPAMLRPGAFAWMLAASTLHVQPAFSAPQVLPTAAAVAPDEPLGHPEAPFAWYDTTRGRANTTRVWVAGHPVLVFDEDQGPIARAVAERLSALQSRGQLYGATLKVQNRGSRFAVTVGDQDVLVFGNRFARYQDTPPMVLAERYVTLLRAAFHEPAIARYLGARAPIASKQESDDRQASRNPLRPALAAQSPDRSVAALSANPSPTPGTAVEAAEEPLATRTESPVIAVSVAMPADLPASASITRLSPDAMTESVLEALVETTQTSAPVPQSSPSVRVAHAGSPSFVRTAGVNRSGYRTTRTERDPWQSVSRGGFDRRGMLVGLASWYGGFFHGRRAADGSRFNMHAFTAAHKTLPFGTILDVCNMRTGKHIFVRITDRGPYIHGRMLDLSRAAARALGMLGSGVERVEATVFRPRKR